MIFPPDGYRPNQAHAAPAAASCQIWRSLLGACLIAVVYLALNYAFLLYLRDRYGGLIAQSILSAMVDGRTPGMLILLLANFALLAVAPILIVRALHGRRAGTLFGPAARTIADFRTSALAGLAAYVALSPLSLGETQPGLPLGTFLGWLPVALIALLIQVTAEELVFRGYLQQQLAARFPTPLVWIGLPTALFAWAHHSPTDYGDNALTITMLAGAFGLLAADLTARTGTLGAAMGFHFANNVAALLLVGIDGDMDGLALRTLALDLTDPAAAVPMAIADLGSMIIGWLAVRLALRV